MNTNATAVGREVFDKIVRAWRTRPNESLTFKQIANISLGSGNSRNASVIGGTIHQFGEYFLQKDRYKWQANWSTIKRDHPNLIETKSVQTQTINNPEAQVDEMIRALGDELKVVRQEMERNPVKAHGAKRLGMAAEESFLYESVVELLGDSELPIPEGVKIALRWGRDYLEATLLSYDPLTTKIIFEVKQPLLKWQEDSEFVVLPKIDELLKAVQGRLVKLKITNSALSRRLLHNHAQPHQLSWANPTQMQNLDQSQSKAIEQTLRQDITFLWGPPGTGKTHTLARLMALAALSGKKVIATAIANVAVDQLASKLVETLESFGEEGANLLNAGRVLRFGYPRLNEVINERRLFPNKQEIQQIRKLLAEARRRHLEIPEKDAEKRALSQKIINDLSSKLRAVTKESIQQASIVLTTAIQTCIETTFDETLFDLAIVDEASMMPIPYVLCVGLLTRERFVIAGDFRQLGPIALSRSDVSLKWLHEDAFHLADIANNRLHPGLAMLSVQRRMHQKICDLINKPFYEGKLESNVSKSKSKASTFPPLPGRPVVLVSLLPEDGSEVQMTDGGSRRNVKSAEVVIDLAKHYVNTSEEIRIGIITPYRAQVSLIKRALKAQQLPDFRLKRIHVGTVHAFQGSESDVIIWDLVETRFHRIGKLFHGNVGERLSNVAISRAQGKLVIVGDPEAFFKAPGENLVAKRLRSILATHFSQGSANIISVGELRL